jgi:hypothetical protein
LFSPLRLRAVAIGQGIFRHFDGDCPCLGERSKCWLSPSAEKISYPFEFPLETDGKKGLRDWFSAGVSYIREW